MRMNSTKGNTIHILLVLSVAVMLHGCHLALDVVTQAIPQTNDYKILTKKGNIDKNRKVYVSLQARRLSSKSEYEWRNEHIVKAIEKAGLKNYEILDPETKTPDFSIVGDSYLLTVSVSNWTAKKNNSGDTELWVPVTATIYALPGKNVLVKAGGDATDTRSFGWSIGAMVSSLLAEMLEEMYSTL